jgi:hypothetical protein
MAAGLASLSDQTVSAPGDSGARLGLGTNHYEDEDPGIAEVLDKPALFAERQHDAIDASVDADRDVVTTDEGHQQVYRDGATRRPVTYLIDRRAQLAGCGDADCSEATRFCDRSRQRCAGQSAAHSRLSYRNVEPQAVRDVHVLLRYVAYEFAQPLGHASGLIFVAGVRRSSVIFTADGWVAASPKGLLHNRKVTK